MEQCSAHDCKNKVSGRKKFCKRCYSREYKKKNPIKTCFYNLKSNSKRRGKYFDLTLEQFTNFCHKTEYHIKKGKTVDSYSIDRIDPEKGYTITNIQILTLGDNSRKGTKKVEYDWVNRQFIVTYNPPRVSVDDNWDEGFNQTNEF